MDNKGYVGEKDDQFYSEINSKANVAQKPYAGMGKEDLLRFSQTPFWNRLRMICVVLFWLTWLSLLVAVIVLTVVFPRCRAPPSPNWWQKNPLYQIYTRSFKDSNNDGYGDIKGITMKLDYLKKLKVEGIIISSVMQSHSPGPGSPVDKGYEIINYKAVDPEFGTLADFDQLVEMAHEKGIKIIMDFVPNHTGTKHPWFEESRKNNATYKNYYIWTSCTQATPRPNNWVSVYSGPAWSWDLSRNACYLHQFLRSQPELNLRNSAVRMELENILRFWLDRGVDGFRVISVTHLFEDLDLRNEPRSGECPANDVTNYNCYQHIYTRGQTEIHDMIARWRTLLEEYTKRTKQYRVLLTDARESIEQTMAYYEAFGRKGAHLPLNYQLESLTTDCDSVCVQRKVDNWLYKMPQETTANWLTGDQDTKRITGKISPKHQKALLLLKLTLPGPSIIYYGEEIGMLDGQLNNSLAVDPVGQIKKSWSRDPYRTPMQWSNASAAGFTNSSSPWLPVNGDYRTKNVMHMNATTSSTNILKTYNELVALRDDHLALQSGAMHWVITNPEIISFIREQEGQKRNSSQTAFADSHYMIPPEAQVAFTTGSMKFGITKGSNFGLNNVRLAPGEGAVFTWDYAR